MAMNSRNLRKDESGQATVEYILLLMVIAGMAVMVNSWMRKFKLGERLARPIQSEYASAYRYGHPKAKGPEDDGGPVNHPRALGGENSFRLFLNSDRK